MHKPAATAATWIEFADRTRMPIAQLGDLDHAQLRLSRLYGLGSARCLCNQADTLEIAICCLHLGGRVRYYLRPHPKSKHLHRTTCVFARGARTPEEIDAERRESERLRIEGGLRVREIANDARQHEERSRGPRIDVAQPSTVLAVIRLLWERAALHVFDPEAAVRTSRDAMTRILDAADLETEAGSLTDMLVVVPAGGDESQLTPLMTHNRRVLDRAIEERLRVFLVAEVGALSSVPDDKKAGTVFVKGLQRQIGWRVAWRQQLARTVEQRFRVAWSLANDERARVLLVATAEPDATRKTLWLRYAALFPVSRVFVPIESSYELDVVAQLVGASRAFRKPLTMEYETLPDFELLDCAAHRAVPLEVFGFTTQSYRDRSLEKARYYDREFGVGGWWSWNAADREEMPPFPPRLTTTANHRLR